MLSKIKAYFQAAIIESRKVTWPSRRDTTNYTLLVIGVSLGVAIFLGALDYLFSWAFQLLLNK